MLRRDNAMASSYTAGVSIGPWVQVSIGVDHDQGLGFCCPVSSHALTSMLDGLDFYSLRFLPPSAAVLPSVVSALLSMTRLVGRLIAAVSEG